MPIQSTTLYLPTLICLAYGAGALAWFADYVRRVQNEATPQEIRKTLAAGAALFCSFLAASLTILFLVFL